MSGQDFAVGWYPLLPAKSLGRRRVSKVLGGEALELLRDQAGAPYVRNIHTGEQCGAVERHGWIYGRIGEPGLFPTDAGRLIAEPSRELRIDGSVRAHWVDVGENILDTTHTAVVHQNYLRRPGDRQQVTAEVEAGDDWISATYPAGAAPSGWGARLLGAHRYIITDLFRAPSLAEVTYTDGAQTVFAARFWLTPVSHTETYIAATLAVPGSGALARLKLAALRLFFVRIFDEDRHILELIAENRPAHGDAPLTFAPQDLLRPGITAILEGRRPATTAPRIALKV